MTCSAYSHAVLVIDSQNCIEATPQGGVSTASVERVVASATKVSLYRYRGITSWYAQKVCDSIIQFEGSRYDFRGAVRSAISSGCPNIRRLLPATLLIEILDDSSKKYSGHDSEFYCSELIVRAFELAGLHLTKHPAHAVSPGGLVKSETLRFVRALKG